MLRSIYTAVSGMITQDQKQNVITNNLANVNTVGFKVDNLAVKKFDDVLLENYDKISGGKNVQNIIGSVSLGCKVDTIDTSFTQGMLQDTDKNTDFGVEGKGFFVVKKNDPGDNKDYYTRDGHFHVNIKGELVNDSGNAVQGRNLQNNSVGAVQVGNGTLESDSFGNLKINGQLTHKLVTVDFNDYNSVKKIGNNLYEGQNATENNTTVVRQKKLEKSNINVVSEMVNMMSTMRSFETNQKVVQSIDETLNKLVNEVGSVR